MISRISFKFSNLDGSSSYQKYNKSCLSIKQLKNDFTYSLKKSAIGLFQHLCPTAAWEYAMASRLVSLDRIMFPMEKNRPSQQ